MTRTAAARAAAVLLALAVPASAETAPPMPFGTLGPSGSTAIGGTALGSTALGGTALGGTKARASDTPPDLAFGAFQRGYFGTALQEATRRISANADDGAAMTLIGEIYAQGLAVKQDPEEAAHWYKLASERRNREGTFAYAMALLNGQGVPKDPVAAKAQFESAARQGHAGAMYNLGVMALKDKGARDYAAAFRAFTAASDAGDLDAMFALATLVRAGQGTAPDPHKAMELFKQAADQKHPGAEVEYGIMAFNGEGMPKDEAAAAHAFQLAAIQGNPVAANRLARLYAAGRGLDKNPLEAARWHLLARAKGIADPWLDGVVTQLSAADRTKLEASLRKTLAQ